ncbi:matrix [Curionopolis virus]|uniref:Matrix protein n=2 Tax=Curionopolis virus TaxID=490110 RepID=A0A0D3R1I9_9RHAB|nr:matrix [Curionopolis virus]AIE12114.1 M protein [Curionopolis virus]AJR28367.1 matrix [Curionopolis virus]
MNRLKRKGMELVSWTGKKEKRSKEDALEASAPLWVYGGPGEEQMWDFGVESEESTAQSLSAKSYTRIKGKWTASLKMVSNRGFSTLEEITHHIGALVDDYTGMNTNRSAYFVHLLALIPHLGGKRDEAIGGYIYQSGYSEVLEFDFLNPNSPSDREWTHSQVLKISVGSLKAKIEYSVKYEPSVRKPVQFKMIYYSPAGGGKIPPMMTYSEDFSLAVNDEVDPIKIE